MFPKHQTFREEFDETDSEEAKRPKSSSVNYKYSDATWAASILTLAFFYVHYNAFNTCTGNY